TRMVSVWPDNPMGWGAGELQYRFQWNFPIFFSPHDPNRLYVAAQVLFVSDDLGHSWRVISPDLTRNDKSKQGPSGGPITKDNTSVEYYSTIFAALESPHEAGVLWAGSDDGLMHLSRDGGSSWSNVTPPDLVEDTQINTIEAHPREKGGLYLAATRYKLDDFEPYLWRTLDYGATWQRIDTGIPRDHFTRAIRADPDREGLLYAGTERGVYVSFDDGISWQSLQLELPIVPITDLQVKEGDLVAATQGRGFWILDDLSLLHQVPSGEADTTEPRLWAPRPVLRLPGAGFFRRSGGWAGSDPPNGAVIHYRIPEELPEETEIRLRILDAGGEEIRTFTPKPAEGEKAGPPRGGAGNDAVLEVEPGSHRLVWNLRYPGADDFEGMVIWNRFLIGPKAVPGTYGARLEVGETHLEVPVEVLPDPRSEATSGDLRTQFDFLLSTRDKLSETHRAIGEIREIRGQIDALLTRVEGDGEATEALRASAESLKEKITGVEEALYQTKNRSPQDPLNFPIRLNDKLAGLILTASVGDYPPTGSMLEVRDHLVGKIDEQLAILEAAWEVELPALEAEVRQAEVPVFQRTKDGEGDRARGDGEDAGREGDGAG
ncbi:MAG: hypothetical protein MI919_00445, partial [Holophagales bacterium]|nr:hypothetical protein [Holophagales bacterium]